MTAEIREFFERYAAAFNRLDGEAVARLYAVPSGIASDKGYTHWPALEPGARSSNKPAGVPTAHCVSNNSAAPCSYLIIGTRVHQDVCHYPDTGRTLHTEGKEWRLLEADGRIYKTGTF